MSNEHEITTPLIEKAKKDITKLVKKIITNKKGHKQSVWVKPGGGEITRKFAESWKSKPSMRKIMEEELESGETTYIERGKDKKEKTRKITQKERKNLEKVLSSNYGKGDEYDDRKKHIEAKGNAMKKEYANASINKLKKEQYKLEAIGDDIKGTDGEIALNVISDIIKEREKKK